MPIADETLLDVSLKQNPEGSIGDASESGSSDGMHEKSAYVEKVVFSVHIYIFRSIFLRQQYFKTNFLKTNFFKTNFLRQFF